MADKCTLLPSVQAKPSCLWKAAKARGELALAGLMVTLYKASRQPEIRNLRKSGVYQAQGTAHGELSHDKFKRVTQKLMSSWMFTDS